LKTWTTGGCPSGFVMLWPIFSHPIFEPNSTG
jgi:hypothetical protein